MVVENGACKIENVDPDAPQQFHEFDGFLTGEIFGDGSGLNGRWPKLRRCGWGVAKVDRNGILQYAIYGPLPGEYDQQVLVAELWALRMTLAHGIAPITFYSDNSAVVKGIRYGKCWCLHHSRNHVELLKEVWQFIEDLGGIGTLGVTVLKVKAHATRAERAEMGEYKCAANNLLTVLRNLAPSSIAFQLGRLSITRSNLIAYKVSSVATPGSCMIHKTLSIQKLDSSKRLELTWEKLPQLELFEVCPPVFNDVVDDNIAKATALGHKVIDRGTYCFCNHCGSFVVSRWKRSMLLNPKGCDTTKVNQGSLNRLRDGGHPQTGKPI